MSKKTHYQRTPGSIPISYFPTLVWDGSTPSRPSGFTYQDPDADDFNQLLIEIQSIQNQLIGPLTMYTLDSSTGDTNARVIKASPGSIYSIQLFNHSAVPCYFKLYDKATIPVVGTDEPVKTICIPG